MFKNQKGFTLIEMLIVLMIISVLIILIVPNLGKKAKDINDKGCDALVAVVETQIGAYRLDNGTAPTSIDLLVPKYIKDTQTKCPNGDELSINTDGEVTKKTP